MLTKLWARDVEPFDELEVPLGSRLNLLTGDNGLGKTFVLDLAWYVLTGAWADKSALARRGDKVEPTIGFQFVADGYEASKEASFSFREQRWIRDGELSAPLVVGVKADGGFNVWDPLRASGPMKLGVGVKAWGPSRQFSLQAPNVWDGLTTDDGVVLCNGLLRDWVSWQYQRPALFKLFSRVLATLSPNAGEALRPGASRRVSIEDVRDVPTLVLPYGDVPVTHASAGMRRVLALAYVLVWAWHEHGEAARLRNQKPLNELALLIDEVDAHLHPQWQRVILPALFRAVSELAGSLSVQVIVSTHAPLVLASVESFFNEATDKLLHFTLSEGGKIVVEDLPWAKQGDVTNWLVSESFGLEQARSREAEAAIEAAEAFMRGEPKPPPLATREAIDAELRRVLAGHDPFWPRWLVETGAVK
ncbi:MAG TPA: AAA family ATPase [Polyangiaceae bacterium]|nr:AAA family ATPase [Polyangiaceae bacterium]